jgi:RNA polymerase sigma-70 factor (ECF subfamily)
MTQPATYQTGDVLEHRPRLLGLAYRMLGVMEEAEDVVQEAYLRWHQDDRADVRSSEAWLVTVVSRLAIDRLRRAATERAGYVGPWLPEPVELDASIHPAAPTPLPAPDHRAELASDLSVALLVLLERLAPEERAAFLLREVFGAEYAEIARILERRPDAVRQMVHRARTRVRAERPRVPVPLEAHGQMLERFMAAIAADDAEATLALLAPEVTLTSDGGGIAKAATRVIAGPDHVMKFLLGTFRKGRAAGGTGRVAMVNGAPSLLLYHEGQLVTTMTFDTDGDRVRAIYVMRNPQKLRRIEAGPVSIV